MCLIVIDSNFGLDTQDGGISHSRTLNKLKAVIITIIIIINTIIKCKDGMQSRRDSSKFKFNQTLRWIWDFNNFVTFTY